MAGSRRIVRLPVMPKLCSIVLLAIIAESAFAATPARRLCIPVIGKWKGSSSTLTVTNTAARPTRVRLSWIIGSPREFSPANMDLMLHGNETRVIDVGHDLLLGREAAGGLRISADADVGAQAIIVTRENGAPASLEATPIRHAVGNGDTTMLGAVNGEGGYRLFVAETYGQAIYFAAKVIVGDTVRGERRYYIEAGHQTTLPIDREFNLKPGEPFTIVVRGINGDGRLIAAGGSMTASQDLVAVRMLRPALRRNRMRWPEVITYSSAAFALIAAALYRRKNSSA